MAVWGRLADLDGPPGGKERLGAEGEAGDVEGRVEKLRRDFIERTERKLSGLREDLDASAGSLEAVLADFARKAEEEEAWVETQLAANRARDLSTSQLNGDDGLSAEESRELDARSTLCDALVERTVFKDIGPGWRF